jgi:hypothetical protein
MFSSRYNYTTVSRLVFYDSDKFVGTCGIVETKRAIANFFPDVASLISECLPERVGFNPAADIPPIVDKFLEKLVRLGGESQIAQPVLAHIVSRFHDFNDERVQLFRINDATQRQRELIRKRYQYVALEETEAQITIVDRLLFASRVAELTLNQI